MVLLCYFDRQFNRSDEHTMAYTLLKNALKELYGTDDKIKTLCYTPLSKPQIKDEVFSISHSCGVVGVVIKADGIFYSSDIISHKICDKNPHSLGLDIECISDKDIAKCKRIAQAKFLKSEQNILFQCVDETEYIRLFVKIWTTKESYGKYTGRGLSDALGFDTQSEHADVQFFSDIITVCDNDYYFTVCYNAE